MDYALVLVIVGCVAVGVTGAVIKTWSLHSRVYSLEDRVGILEGTLTREVKTRAAQERWKRPDKAEADLSALSAMAKSSAPPSPTRKYNWWETGSKVS